MARCHWHWRNVLICVCSPCICLVMLFLYTGIMLCIGMNNGSMPGTIISKNVPLRPHFVASGVLSNDSFGPLPKTFWTMHLNRGALWNHLQHLIDKHFNPILHPRNSKVRFHNKTFYESLLRQSFSEVTNLDDTKRNFDQLPPQIQVFVSHMQVRDYPILIQPDGLCGAGAKDEKEPPLLLLAIKSTDANFKNRQVIRQTWGKVGWVTGRKTNSSRHGGYIRRVFLLGKDDLEGVGVDLTEALNVESQVYGDILRWDFKDTFFNLTLKDVLFWKWFSRNCERTYFVFKGDDDVFVNTPNMITYLQDQLRRPAAYKTIREFMVGDVIGAAAPNRVNNSKYFIPGNFYQGLYPTYAGGGGVIYSGLLAKRLQHISNRVHLFPIDDVYVGMCMLRLNALPTHHPAFLTFDFPKNEELEPCAYHKILLVHKRSTEQIVQLWAHINETERQCWHVPLRIEEKKKT